MNSIYTQVFAKPLKRVLDFRRLIKIDRASAVQRTSEAHDDESYRKVQDNVSQGKSARESYLNDNSKRSALGVEPSACFRKLVSSEGISIHVSAKAHNLRMAATRLSVKPQNVFAERSFVDLKTDVKKIREKTGLSQEDFSKVFCIPLATLKNWEQGRRKPDSAVCLLLNLISNDPEGVAKEAEKVLRAATA